MRSRRDRRRQLAVAAVIAAGLVAGVRVAGQYASPRTLLGTFGPPPLERGIIRDEQRAPDSQATRVRRSIRAGVRTADRIGTSGARYVPGRVIVKYRGADDFELAPISPDADPEATAAQLRARPDVEYAQASYRLHTDFVPNDPFYRDGSQWNLPFIDLERAWDIQPAAGSAITVAVLDTGIAYTNATLGFHASAFSVDTDGNPIAPDPHTVVYPSLGDLTLAFVPATQLASPGRFVAPHDFIWDDDLPLDLDGHGTHVSGTIGQLTNDNVGTAGVAFNVKLMPVKVIDSAWDDILGAPNAGTDDVLARGIRYAADNGAKVLNLSIGRTGPPAPVVEAAMRYAVAKGAFLAVAGGNGFEDGNEMEVVAEIASRIQGAVSVAAVDRGRNHAYYSTTGNYIELAAPGGSFRGFGAAGGILQQTLNLDLVDTYLLPPSSFVAPHFDSLAYFYFIGTSQATPHVSGVAAMLMQQGITDPGAVESALERFATDLGATGRDPQFGFGLINARNSLRGLGLTK